ncbi:hypothetical protein GA830_10550 [Mesorhizobium sp. NBSH29]|uniref:hypothetical protein n=1 Tax=Mesorhizobium sp. NBSH29 TaxID=2654249 RepID=UPI0018964FA7|nr:hypothetical protein [Mesorhizobium sp. NBSH29]QPC87134.1 hypothetical protein GA830_10550 [Mesorhizobium sp. NBSH29]
MAKKTKAETARTGNIAPVVNRTEMAIHLGVTIQWIGKLAEEGVLIRADGRGKFQFSESVQSFIRHKTASIERQSQSTSADALRDQRAHEISIKIARQERDLIPLDDAMAVTEKLVGIFLESISGLPARMTRVPRERQRFEAICDEERLRLSDRFGELAKTVRTGIDSSETLSEDNA